MTEYSPAIEALPLLGAAVGGTVGGAPAVAKRASSTISESTSSAHLDGRRVRACSTRELLTVAEWEARALRRHVSATAGGRAVLAKYGRHYFVQLSNGGKRIPRFNQKGIRRGATGGAGIRPGEGTPISE